MSEEAGRLSREKAALLATVQSLKGDNDRLRAFKRKLLHSLQNDSEASHPKYVPCPFCAVGKDISDLALLSSIERLV